MTCLPPKTIHRPPPTQLREMTLVIVINIRLFFCKAPMLVVSMYCTYLPNWCRCTSFFKCLYIVTNTQYALRSYFQITSLGYVIIIVPPKWQIEFPAISSSSLLQNQTETVEKLTNRYLKYYIKPKWTTIGFIYFFKKTCWFKKCLFNNFAWINQYLGVLNII